MVQAAGDLTRVKNHDPDESWPSLIEIVAYFGPPDNPRKGKYRRIEIPADQFFGFGAFGAPLSGDAIVAMVNKIRRAK